MEYNIRFIAGARFVAIGIIGIVLSISIPIYLKINFDINSGLMVGLMLGGFVVSSLLAYFTSKRNEHFTINDHGLTTKNHGEVRWHEVQGLYLEESSEDEVFTIKFRLNQKIAVPSKIYGSKDRETFISFKEEIIKRVAEGNRMGGNILQLSNPYDRKVYKYMTYIITIFLLLLTPYILYLAMAGEMALEKVSAVLLIYASSLPFIFNVYLAKMKKSKKISG